MVTTRYELKFARDHEIDPTKASDDLGLLRGIGREA